MRRFVFFFVIAAILLGPPQQARAQSGLTVTEVRVDPVFGEHVTFQVRVQTPVPVQQASIVFSDDFDNTTRVQPANVSPDGWLTYRYEVLGNALRPFTTITFRFEATLQGGQVATSPIYSVRYVDNRFDWQTLSDGLARVHWYAGDQAFGQAILDASLRSLNGLNELIPRQSNSSVEVYVYQSVDDLKGALFLGGEQWIGGHANPRLGVVMVAIQPGPGQGIEMETLIPHELTHVMLYRRTGDGYDNLPVWLSEGIASLAELYPNPDYTQALQVASENESLLPIVDLCDTLPPDASRAFLAYAESASFVRYLRDTYGISSLVALTSAYADGLDCEQGTVRTLGVSLAQLDFRWRESVLGENVAGVFFRNMLPYFAMLIFMLLLPFLGLVQRRFRDDSTT